MEIKLSDDKRGKLTTNMSAKTVDSETISLINKSTNIDDIIHILQHAGHNSLSTILNERIKLIIEEQEVDHIQIESLRCFTPFVVEEWILQNHKLPLLHPDLHMQSGELQTNSYC